MADEAAWADIARAAEALRGRRISGLFAADPRRVDRYSASLDSLHLDYSRHLLDDRARDALLTLAGVAGLPGWIESLFTGDTVNATEGRPALHTAMRGFDPHAVIEVDGENVVPAILRERERLAAFVGAFERGELLGASGERLDTVVNLGVGGSDLGAAMATEALAACRLAGIATHFVSGMDGVQLADVLARLDPARTLFIISSKSFGTADTLGNAAVMREWLCSRLGGDAVAHHVAAVSANARAMEAWGVAPAYRFPLQPWVGGRYSVSSAVGLPLALGVGWRNFLAFLGGMEEMDRHFREAPLARNMPVVMGLLAVWHRNALDCHCHVVLPYDHRLARFPAYLQQLEMESNGKSVTRDGRPVDRATAPVLFGDFGGNAQHSFLQLLHQGTEPVSADFLLPVAADAGTTGQRNLALANGLAQARALMEGRDAAAVRQSMEAAGLPAGRIASLLAHRTQPGNRSSSTLLFPCLDPRHLGMLIALYEHRTFVQAVLWEINPFDQWGVELGKLMADDLIDAVAGTAPVPADTDPSTAALITRIHRLRGSK